MSTKSQKKPSLLKRIIEGSKKAGEEISKGYGKIQDAATEAQKRKMFEVDLWGESGSTPLASTGKKKKVKKKTTIIEEFED